MLRHRYKLGCGALGRYASLLFLVCFLFMAGQANAAIQIVLEKSDGDKVNDVTIILAKIISNEGIDKVEFRVDDELRYTDTSVPYEYTWDTIKDPEGSHTLSVTAYDSNNVSKRSNVKLFIDNGIGGGIADVLEKAKAALQEKDLDTAIKFCRRALKGEPGNLEAARTLGSIHATKKDWIRAVAALEKIPNLETSFPAMREMAYYRTQRALLPENASNLFNDISAVDELRHKINDKNVQEIVQKAGSDNLAIGDAYFSAGRYEEATKEYMKVGEMESSSNAALTRLALGLVTSGDSDRALRLLRPRLRAKKDDAPLRAVYAFLLISTRKYEEAIAVLGKDLTDQYPPALALASFANSALGKKREALAFAQDAVSLAPKSVEAHYALAIAATDLRIAEQEIAQALSLNSFHWGPYLNFASRILVSKRTDRLEMALNITDLVLKNDPKNIHAKQMQALIYLYQRKVGDAEVLLKSLLATGVTSPDLLMTVAIYYEAKGDETRASKALEDVRKIDPLHFDSIAPPAPIKHIDYINRIWLGRAGFFLDPATLFPTKN